MAKFAADEVRRAARGGRWHAEKWLPILRPYGSPSGDGNGAGKQREP